MKFKLSIGERLNLLMLLPEKHDYVTMLAREKVVHTIATTEEEVKEYNIKTDTDENGGKFTTWNKKGNKEKEFEIGEIMTEVIKAKLKELSDKKEITPFITALYGKFVEGK